MPRLSLSDALRGPVPPDGYRYKDPESGFVCHSFDYSDWVQQEKKHLEGNGRKVPFDLELIMQEQLCMTLPPGWCSYDPPNSVVLATLEGKDIMHAASTFGSWVLNGMPLVEQEEADRRALVCSRCYLNVSISGCGVCQAVVDKLAGSLTSKHDRFIRKCAACKCNLRAKVHFPLEVLDKENPGVQELYPEHCWLKRGGLNRK